MQPPTHWRQLLECGGLEAALDWAGRPSSRLRCGRAGRCLGGPLKIQLGGLPTQGGAALALDWCTAAPMGRPTIGAPAAGPSVSAVRRNPLLQLGAWRCMLGEARPTGRQPLECGGFDAALARAWRPSGRLRCGPAGRCFGGCLKIEWGGPPTQGGAALALGWCTAAPLGAATASADWQSAVSRIGNPQTVHCTCGLGDRQAHTRSPIGSTGRWPVDLGGPPKPWPQASSFQLPACSSVLHAPCSIPHAPRGLRLAA